jgi:selenocysteine lyase/cysteine desulfurase
VVLLAIADRFPEQLGAELDRVFRVAFRSGLQRALQARSAAGTPGADALRFSPGCPTTPDEMEYTLGALQQLLQGWAWPEIGLGQHASF